MAQAPAPPPPSQTPTPTLWQCHNCKDAGPIKYENQKICATCGHRMCKICKKDNDIPSPMGPASARVHSSPLARGIFRGMHAQDPDIWPTAHLPRLAPTIANTNIRYRANHKLTSRPSRPSPRGWWRCSECHNVNNPDLTAGRCSSCNHVKCPSCTAVRVG